MRAILVLFGILALSTSAMADGVRQATLSCDFTKAATTTSGYDAYGRLQIKLDLDKSSGVAACLTDACAFDGPSGVLRISSLDGPLAEARFSKDSRGHVSTPRLLLFGSNGDDSEVLITTGYYGDATITLMVDGNLGQSSAPISCDLALE